MEAARHFGKQLSFICVPISFDKVLPSDNLDQMKASFDIFIKVFLIRYSRYVKISGCRIIPKLVLTAQRQQGQSFSISSFCVNQVPPAWFLARSWQLCLCQGEVVAKLRPKTISIRWLTLNSSHGLKQPKREPYTPLLAYLLKLVAMWAFLLAIPCSTWQRAFTIFSVKATVNLNKLND